MVIPAIAQTRDFIVYRFDRDSPVVRQRRHAGDAGGEFAEVTAPGSLRRGGEAQSGAARFGIKTHAVAG